MGMFDFLSGADEEADALKKVKQEALGYERTGQEQAAGILQPAANYGPIQSRIWDLLGLNGPQAQEAAYGAFRDSPGVQWLRQQGEQSAMRGASAGGRLASGRTLADLARFGQGSAEQSFGDFFNRLTGQQGVAMGAAGGIADIRAGGGSRLANLAAGLGSQYAAAKGTAAGVPGQLIGQGLQLGGYAAGQYAGRPPAPAVP